MPTIELLGPAQALTMRDEVAELFGAAFAAPPYSKTRAAVEAFLSVFERHAGRAGFSLALAREGGAPAGFAYGYTSGPGQWWHDVVAGGLPPAEVSRWLTGAFELTELGVRPALQGRGLGGALHDALLAGRPEPTAVLSTIAEETAGLRLYRRRGWRTLHPGLRFPGTPTPYIIMGRDLG